MKHIPFILIYSRIIISALIILIAIARTEHTEVLIATLMIIGLITDVFDGIIARKLEISSERLRIWDSNADQFFWAASIGAIAYLKFSIIKELLYPIIILIATEILAYLISYIKFKRTVATHSLMAKVWTLSLLVFLLEMILNSTSTSFYVCFWLGLISRLEIIAIILKLKNWCTDVPSIFAVGKLNKGLPIKKNKLFNS